MSEPISAFAAHRASLKGTKNSPKSVAKKAAAAAAATNGATKKNAANTSKSKHKTNTSEGNKSKANTAHLTKAEQRKQRELEAYLQRQLEKDDVAGEDVFSDEYTMNSYSDEYTDDSHCCSRCEPGAAAAQATPPTPESKKQANKRKSMEAKEAKNNAETNGDAAESKKAKKEAAKIAAEANKKSADANKKANRKSMDKKETETADDNAAADAHNKSAHKKHKKHSESMKKEANADSEGYEICGEICERRPKKVKAKAATVAAVAAAVTPVAPPPAESTPVNVCRRKSGVKLEPLSPPANVTKMNSIDEGLKCFRWLLNPVGVEDFYAKYWERNACLVKRQQDNYFNHLISFEAIDQMLLKNYVEFTKNIDVTSYKNGVRETLNPDGRAMPPIVWEHYGNGCSIRLLNPQTFLPALYTLSTTMQEYFHCLVGANAYLTPPNSQGFAPHYDDIEAFVLQIEGRKRWRLYKPRSKTEELPRVSSRNFKPNEIGKPIFDEVLHPGDILYFPRGTIHQACTEPGFHSLHITLSVYQKQSYADLFEQLMPRMLERAIAASVDMRRGLPLHTWQSAGIAHSECDTQQRHELIDKVTQLLTRSMRAAPVAELLDAAVDQLAKKFQREALPPEVLPSERVRTIFGSTSTTNERGECVCDYDIDLRTNIRLLRANILRLVEEEEKVRIYYYLDNSKEYCEYEPNYIEIDAADAGSVEVLIKSYPQYIGVAQLPLDEDEQKITVATALWERGLLMMEKPFK